MRVLVEIEDSFFLLEKTVNERNNPVDQQFTALLDPTGKRKGIWFCVHKLSLKIVQTLYYSHIHGLYAREDCYQEINQTVEKDWIYFSSDNNFYKTQNRLIVAGFFLVLISIPNPRFNFHKSTFYELLLRHKEGFGFDLKQKYFWEELFGEKAPCFPEVKSTNEKIQSFRSNPKFSTFKNQLVQMCKDLECSPTLALVSFIQDQPNELSFLKSRIEGESKKGYSKRKRGSTGRPDTWTITKALYVKDKFCLSNKTWEALGYAYSDVDSVYFMKMFDKYLKENIKKKLSLKPVTLNEADIGAYVDNIEELLTISVEQFSMLFQIPEDMVELCGKLFADERKGKFGKAETLVAFSWLFKGFTQRCSFGLPFAVVIGTEKDTVPTLLGFLKKLSRIKKVKYTSLHSAKIEVLHSSFLCSFDMKMQRALVKPLPVKVVEKVEKMAFKDGELQPRAEPISPNLRDKKIVDGKEVSGQVEAFIFLESGTKQKVTLLAGEVEKGRVVEGVVKVKNREVVPDKDGEIIGGNCSYCFAGRQCDIHKNLLINPFQKDVEVKEEAENCKKCFVAYISENPQMYTLSFQCHQVPEGLSVTLLILDALHIVLRLGGGFAKELAYFNYLIKRNFKEFDRVCKLVRNSLFYFFKILTKQTKKKLLPNLKEVSASIKQEYVGAPDFQRHHVELSRATKIELQSLTRLASELVDGVCAGLSNMHTISASLGSKWAAFHLKKIEFLTEKYANMQIFYLPTYGDTPRICSISSHPCFEARRKQILVELSLYKTMVEVFKEENTLENYLFFFKAITKSIGQDLYKFFRDIQEGAKKQ